MVSDGITSPGSPAGNCSLMCIAFIQTYWWIPRRTITSFPTQHVSPTHNIVEIFCTNNTCLCSKMIFCTKNTCICSKVIPLSETDLHRIHLSRAIVFCSLWFFLRHMWIMTEKNEYVSLVINGSYVLKRNGCRWIRYHTKGTWFFYNDRFHCVDSWVSHRLPIWKWHNIYGFL